MFVLLAFSLLAIASSVVKHIALYNNGESTGGVEVDVDESFFATDINGALRRSILFGLDGGVKHYADGLSKQRGLGQFYL
jgi:hypothetical protein